jgi:DNA repair protein RecN (Recombination protein N)
MLKSITITNYALIDHLDMDFGPGFSVITGETGAGKSIILGALSLVLGQRADSRQIKQGETKCIVESVFDISKYNLRPFFEEHDWVYDDKELILRRELWSNGRSRAFVNDSPVYLNDLKELSNRLIDIHSQHQNLALNEDLFQLMVIDSLAQTGRLSNEYTAAYADFRAAEKQLNELRELSQKNKEEEDYLRFQLQTLKDAALQPDEQEALEAELEAITHTEEIKSALFAIVSQLSGDEQNVESMLKSALDNARSIRQVFPKIEDIAARIESAYIDLKDVRQEAERFFEEVEFNPERQQIVEDRLSLIYGLEKKHGVSNVQELLTLQQDIASKLENIDSLDEKIAALEKEVNEKQQNMLEKARKLSAKRRAAAPLAENRLTEKLTYLGMPNARFEIRFSEKSQPDESGIDRVQFWFSANKNIDPQPVAQIASGGEISRLMLCIKAMIAGATALPTIIFDEIDTGTSGEMADKMGSIMQQMSNDMQVIAITHLPQIASKGTTHYVVYKEEKDDATHTYMKKLSDKERIPEIARMLSGAETTVEAIENAKVMLGFTG